MVPSWAVKSGGRMILFAPVLADDLRDPFILLTVNQIELVLI